MASVLESRPISFISSLTHVYKEDMELRRIERLDLIWRIANRAWTDYLDKPSGCEKAVWDGVKSRFTVTDLQSPVLRTIVSASHGGKISRRINKCVNLKEVQEFVNSAEYDTFVKATWKPESILYGTAYAVPGFRDGKLHLISLPPVTTQIVTEDDDVEKTIAVVADYQKFLRSYEENGIYKTMLAGSKLTQLPDSNYGFIPVSIARGFKSDCLSPYGVDMVWPATQETVQCTYLMNDVMVLERLQSFSTLVIRGMESAQPKSMGMNPFNYIRLQPGAENDAKYISPDAAIDQIDKLIASKFERAAVQCQVPVEIFTKSKSGVNQSASSSNLNHKPLYDLVVFVQEQGRLEELNLIAMIDAMYSWLKSNKQPQDLQKHIDMLDAEIQYERESNPSINQSDAQAYESLVASRFVKHRKAYYKFNPDGNDEEQAELEGLRDADRIMALPAPDGFEEEEDESGEA